RVVTTRLTTSKIICRYRGRAGAQAAVEAARSASVARRVEAGVTASPCEGLIAGRIVDPRVAWLERIPSTQADKRPREWSGPSIPRFNQQSMPSLFQAS